MICRKCQAAAEVGLSAPFYGKTTMAFKNDTSVYTHEVFEKVARLLHSECKGSTHCDCQHKPAGYGINYTKAHLINEEIRNGLNDARNDESPAEAVRENSSNGSEKARYNGGGTEGDFRDQLPAFTD